MMDLFRVFIFFFIKMDVFKKIANKIGAQGGAQESKPTATNKTIYTKTNPTESHES